jgi:hypothetical protein
LTVREQLEALDLVELVLIPRMAAVLRAVDVTVGVVQGRVVGVAAWGMRHRLQSRWQSGHHDSVNGGSDSSMSQQQP